MYAEVLVRSLPQSVAFALMNDTVEQRQLPTHNSHSEKACASQYSVSKPASHFQPERLIYARASSSPH
jgi:hypothetical protein